MTESKPHLRARIRQRVDRLEEIVLGRDKPPERHAPAAAPVAAPSKWARFLSWARKLLPMVGSAAFVVLFVYATNYYASTRQRVEADPDVVNLTAAGDNARIAFGPSPTCGDKPCWVEPDFDDSAWTAVSLPLRPDANIRALPGYKSGGDQSRMFYRIRLTIPPKLQSLPEEISFSPVYVWHRFFAVYLNGRLIFTGNGEQGQTANFPIPKQDIHDGKVQFTVVASVAPTDEGITSRTSMLLGPKTLLDGVYVHGERSMYTYYLLFLLAKGSIFVIFTLFFLFTRGQPGLAHFLVFAFFDASENIFIADYFAAYMPFSVRIVGYFGFKAIAVAGLLNFLMTFYRATRIRRFATAFGIAAIIGVVSLSIARTWLEQVVSLALLFDVSNALLVVAVVVGIVVGLLSSRKWRKRTGKSGQLQNFERFTGVLIVYLGLIVWEFYFKEYGGFDKRAVFDLGLFIWLALSTAMDMGLQEGQIKTLESHMEEKRRMELELQEAAEIARAFFPQSAPEWAPYVIRTYHKPLTENSGDWYAFEQSPSGKLFHFIMCDITGHGVQAAIVVSTCKSVLSSFVHTNPEKVEDPQFIAHFMSDLNATLFRNGAGNHVSTLLGVTFDPAARQIHFVSAGHPSPLFIAKAPDTSGVLGTPPRPQALISRHSVLGVSPQFKAEMSSHAFSPGDHLLTFSDGLPVGSNIKALKAFLAETFAREAVSPAAPVELYGKIWEAETKRTSIQPNDDVSIVWFSAA